MLSKISTFTELRTKAKLPVGLLATGTFMEYFDLMLYVHMGVLLNELFFNTTDPKSIAFLSALGISVTFVFRPVGALIFGQLGDFYGRKIVLWITTFIMTIACAGMVVAPTYAEIGVTASVVVLACRILQSISSVGEITSCDLYFMETTNPPIQYPLSGVTDIFGALGGTAALGVASLVTMNGFNWRWAFVVGCFIGVLGFYIRRAILETADFSNIVAQIKLIQEKFNLSYKEAKKIVKKELAKNNPTKKVLFALFTIQCVYPLYYYFAYIYCGDLLKSIFHYSSAEVIFNNFILSFACLFRGIAVYWISYYVNPLKILKVQLLISSMVILVSLYLFNNLSEPYHLITIQYLLIIFAIHGMPAFSIFYKYIPILTRFTSAGITYSVGRALMFGITSFGLIVLIEWIGNWGIFALFAFTLIAYTIALFYFNKLEKESNK
jgi:MHS family proline/betaine transporter-like MFS transporter